MAYKPVLILFLILTTIGSITFGLIALNDSQQPRYPENELPQMQSSLPSQPFLYVVPPKISRDVLVELTRIAHENDIPYSEVLGTYNLLAEKLNTNNMDLTVVLNAIRDYYNIQD